MVRRRDVVYKCKMMWYIDAAALMAALLTRRPMKTIRAVFSGAVAMLLWMSGAAQGPIAADQPASVTGPSMGATMMRFVPYPYEMYTLPGSAPAVPYASCYRVGRCSAYDLYRFRDRPNRLTRLAPEAPPERPPSISFLATLKENRV